MNLSLVKTDMSYIYSATAEELLQHPWIVGDNVAVVPLTSALTELRRFHARTKFKAAVLSVQTINQLGRALGSTSRTESLVNAAALAAAENTTVSV